MKELTTSEITDFSDNSMIFSPHTNNINRKCKYEMTGWGIG